jgi:VanZ family protein
MGIPRRWAWIPLVLWMAVIFRLSAQPAPDWGGPSSAASVFRNSGHALEYGVLALLAALVLPRDPDWPRIDKRTYTMVLLLIVLFAISDEYHQHFTPHRDASACDVLTDTVGAACTLSAIVFAGGRSASEERLARIFYLGIPAVLLAGTIATFVPSLVPWITWL